MKDSMSSTITNVHDFLQDAQGFLEQTLASEKLSRLALEQRTRLITKLSTLIKEYENHHQMQLYIDMSPTLKSFFQSSEGSTSDNSSLRDQVPVNEEFYDVPHGNMSYDGDQPTMAEDESDAPVFPPLPLAMETKKMGFMQRLLKTRNKTPDSLAAKNQNRSATKNVKEGEDDQSRRESGDTEIFYDDAVAVRASRADPAKEEPATYDDVSGIPTLAKKSKKSVTSKSQPNVELYDDASQIIVNKEPEEDYEYVANGSQEAHNNNNDSDKVSMKSGISNYGASATSHRWHISALEAKTQALRYGCMKRRNGRKLLSAWRNCYSVLLPAHLLMYAGEGDNQPRVVIDLSEPNIRVKRMLKQGVDSKRLKTHPFVLLHEDRPLYEMSTKSREETEEWIVALQAILIQVGDSQDTKTDKIDDDDDSVYDDLPENIQQREIQSKMESIQGRNLPSLPAVEQENKTSLQSQQKSANKVNMPYLFQRGRSTSSEEEQPLKRQSVDSSTNTDDVYQELPSPTASGTPYSSLDSLKRSSEDIYYNVEDVPLNKDTNNSDLFGQQSQRVPDRSLRWPTPPPEDDIPVYDVPSPTIRPLSTVSVKMDEDETADQPSFASLISQSRNLVFQRKISSSGSVTVVSNTPEVYDVPASKPRPISMVKDSEPETLKAYDRVPTPPRTVIPSPETNFPPPPSQVNKLARSWKEKLDKPLTNFKKETSPPTKCLPKPSTETKSVGRCFSRTSPPRTPLASLTELLASKNGNGLKPSALKMNAANIKENSTSDLVGFSSGNKQGTKPNISLKPKVGLANNNSFSNKKDPPPRPPAPIRSPNKMSESVSMSDELSRKLMQRAMKSEQVSESVTETEVKDNVPSSLKEQYKARWAYVATNQLELSINSGDIVQVLNKTDANWLVQARNNKKGFVPRDYLVPVPKKVLSLTKIGEAPITV